MREVEAEKSVSASSRNQQAGSLRSPDVQSDKSPSRTGVPRETRALPGRKIDWLWFFPGMEWAHPSGGKEKSISPATMTA